MTTLLYFTGIVIVLLGAVLAFSLLVGDSRLERKDKQSEIDRPTGRV